MRWCNSSQPDMNHRTEQLWCSRCRSHLRIRLAQSFLERDMKLLRRNAGTTLRLLVLLSRYKSLVCTGIVWLFVCRVDSTLLLGILQVQHLRGRKIRPGRANSQTSTSIACTARKCQRDSCCSGCSKHFPVRRNYD